MARIIGPNNNPFTATGVIGKQQYSLRRQNKIRAVAENVGVTNAIDVKGRIDGTSSFDTIGTLTGATAGQFDISDYDLIQFECTTFEDDGGALLFASKFK